MSEQQGRKNDNQKPDTSLIPSAATLEEAAVWTFGKQKYSAHNWHKGISYSRILSALDRHLQLLKAGNDYDYENGFHNGAAIRCCAAMLIQFTLENRTDLDDRMVTNSEIKEYINKMSQGNGIQDLLGEKHGKN